MKTSIHIEDYTTTELHLHPMQEKVYGRESVDAGLVETIREGGIIEPLIVDQQGQIVSGSRRWKAAMELRLSTVPIRRIEGSDPELLELLIKANQQRSKTAGQKAREAAALFRIEKARAAEREKAGVPLGSEVAKGRASEIVAKLTGQCRATVEKQVEIVEKAEAGNENAIEILAELDADKTSLAEAYRDFKQWDEDAEKTAAEEAEKANHGDKDTAPGFADKWDDNKSYREYAEQSKRKVKTDAQILEEAERLIAAGKKIRAQKAHPDRGGTTEEMQHINLAAEWLIHCVHEERHKYKQLW